MALQPSEEERAIQCIDQRLRVSRPLQFRRPDGFLNDASLYLKSGNHMPVEKHSPDC
jgi:hypothetical protein